MRHLQTFSNYLWRGFLIIMYCNLLTKSWFANQEHVLELATIWYSNFFMNKLARTDTMVSMYIVNLWYVYIFDLFFIIFPTNFSDEFSFFLIFLLTYKLLTNTSFRIGVPSILFLCASTFNSVNQEMPVFE